jgi:hypothetical protein
MAEGRIRLAPGPCRTNWILLEPPGTCRHHFNSELAERGFVRQVASRSPSSLGHWDVNPRGPAGESRESLAIERQEGH